MKYLVVVDMQNDFVDGALGTPEARAIVPHVMKKVREFDGAVLFTRDTHTADYLETQEGKMLPVSHCIKGTKGHELIDGLPVEGCQTTIIDKPTFGSVRLGEYFLAESEKHPVESITFIGLCTDICVISNAFLVKAFLPEVPLLVDASCCAGVTEESHRRALESMKTCQIQIINE